MQNPDSLMGRLNKDADEGQTVSQRGNQGAENVQAPKMQIEFRANGTFSTITQMGRVNPKPKIGNWEMVSFDAVSNKMQVKCKIGLQETEHEIEFVDTNTIRLVPPNMAGLSMKIRFQRQ